MNLINYTTIKTYTQLNHEARIKISALLNVGLSQSEIAKQIGVHRSTISREVKRGSVTIQNYDLTYSAKYEAKTAQRFCYQRNLNSRKKPKCFGNEKLLKEVENQVKNNKYSFEVIAGRMKYLLSKELYHSITFSFKTLYNYRKKKLLHIPDSYMPSYTYSKSSKATRRSNIAGKSIALRSEEVNQRIEPGHWEMDCIVGPLGTKESLLTLSERVLRYELIFKLEAKTLENVGSKIDGLEIALGLTFNDVFKSITTDNGVEFQNYNRIEKSKLNPNEQRTNQYFAHPYSSWERGTNENLNREIRRHFPKGTKFKHISETKIHDVQNWMNHKPRKVLGFKTPFECLCEKFPEIANLIS
jgi:IS30 family transposase